MKCQCVSFHSIHNEAHFMTVACGRTSLYLCSSRTSLDGCTLQIHYDKGTVYKMVGSKVQSIRFEFI